jgi:2-phosphoglycerate kinase
LAKIVTTGLSAKLLPALPPPQPSKLKKKLPRRTRTLPSITNGEDVLYIIGGPPRCGKTTLSVALARKLQIPYFSIDHIASVIPPYIPAERQDESFPLKALRQQVNNDNERFFEAYSAEEIVAVYQRQAATVWPGVRSFISYAIEDEHSLILEGWQLLPGFLAEIPFAKGEHNVQIRFLYKTNVEEIVSGLKANDPFNDWVLTHTKNESSFTRIARMIACFGEATERNAREQGFEAINMDRDFAKRIVNLTADMTA